MTKVLVVDDDNSLRRILEHNLLEDGYGVVCVADGEGALRAISQQPFDVVITDVKMPGIGGIGLLQAVKKRAPDTAVIVMTAFGTIEMAVEAMKEGAFEYVTKPFNRDEISLTVQRALETRALHRENLRLKQNAQRKFGLESIVGDSPQILEVFNLIRKVSDTDAAVLITGESGTGKELVAKAIHYQSKRAQQPFIAINCAAIPSELLESELFGHKKGAFTGAVNDTTGKFVEADGGTLFLDEIGDLPIGLQAKILRALQEMEVNPVGSNESTKVDTRILSATNKDLEDEIESGSFREDLFYRLAVVPIHVPSLRERRDDIPLLIAHFIANRALNEKVKFSKEAMEAFKRYHWKGNVRELENTIETILILREEDHIHVDDLPIKIRDFTNERKGYEFLFPQEGIGLEEVENDLLVAALRQTGWNKSHAARLLKIPRHMLLHRMEKFGIPLKEPADLKA